MLEHLKNRATPPASYYFVAPMWGLSGDNRFALRLPFALCGMAVVAIVARWLVLAGVRRWTIAWVLLALALNVSFLLFGRQCRYFVLATLLTTAGGFAYWYFDGSRFRLILLTTCLCLLAATHYLHFAAAAAALVVDYAFFRRRETQLTVAQWGASSFRRCAWSWLWPWSSIRLVSIRPSKRPSPASASRLPR
ncbi:MAG: hypothetical protein QM775_15775 [Pirellulales bacterium]